MKLNKLAYALWLPSSYPSKIEPYNGDFIQRHAQAASAFIPVHVLYFVRDKGKRFTRSIHVEEQQKRNLVETIVYYATRDSAIGIIDQFFSMYQFRKLYKKTITDLFSSRGLPKVVHVHIAFKAGIVATWIKKKYEIPFFLSEHSTIYLTEARPNLQQLGILKKYLISRIISKASKVFCVSDYLGKAMKRKWPSINYKVIPNVVDTRLFYPAASVTHKAHSLIHISNLNYQKNPQALFAAMKILKDRGIEFSLEVFGVRDGDVEALANKHGVEGQINFHEEVPQQILAQHLRNADLLILFSRYETFGCVIIEANACGVPVVVADMPVMHELVTHNRNGVLVKPQTAAALAESVINIIHRKVEFNKNEIVATVSMYDYSAVGKMFLDEYVSFDNTEDG